MALHPDSRVRFTHWCVCVCIAIARLEQRQGIAFTAAETARRAAVERFVNDSSALSGEAIATFEPWLPTATLFDAFDRHLHDADLGLPPANLHPSWLVADRFSRETGMHLGGYLAGVGEQLFTRLVAVAAGWTPSCMPPVSGRLPILPERDKERLRALAMDGLLAPIEARVAQLQPALERALTDALRATAEALSPMPSLRDGIASPNPAKRLAPVILN